MGESPNSEIKVRKGGSAWGQGRRLQFIDYRLRWEGRINRTDLVDYFGISVPQASLDIGSYGALAPANLRYDHSSKTYVATEEFDAVFPRNGARRYLAELLAVETGVVEADAIFSCHGPDVYAVSAPARALDERTVAGLVKAIRDRGDVQIEYQSMSSVEPSHRVISPHALGHDGFRWHVRAYCHNRNRFSDFVLGRILDLASAGPSAVESTRDVEWHTIVQLVLTTNPDLAEAKRKVLELDYGMIDGEVILECRQASLFYTLRRLGLDRANDRDPESQHIVLKNREMVEPYLLPSASSASNSWSSLGSRRR